MKTRNPLLILTALAAATILTSCGSEKKQESLIRVKDEEFAQLWTENYSPPDKGLKAFWESDGPYFLALSPYITESYDFLKAMIPLAWDAGHYSWDLEILLEDDLLGPRYAFNEAEELLAYIKWFNSLPGKADNPVALVKTGERIKVRDLTEMEGVRGGQLLYFPQLHMEGRENKRISLKPFQLDWNRLFFNLPHPLLPGMVLLSSETQPVTNFSFHSVFTENSFSGINIFFWKNTEDLHLVTWKSDHLVNDGNRSLYKPYLPENIYIKDNDEIYRYYRKLFNSAAKAIKPELK